MSYQYCGKPSNYDNSPPPTSSFYTATHKGHHHCDGQQRKEPVCVFCKGGHKGGVCNSVTDPKEGLAIEKRDKLCFNCLARHKVTQCTSKFSARSDTTPAFATPSLQKAHNHNLTNRHQHYLMHKHLQLTMPHSSQ